MKRVLWLLDMSGLPVVTFGSLRPLSPLMFNLKVVGHLGHDFG